MDSFWQLEIILNSWLQNLGSWLTTPMRIFSFLGQEDFFILIMPVIYWCFDAALGFRIALMLLLSSGFNSFLKQIFRTPRPFWFDARIQPLAVERTFGMPSGHAQVSSSVWGLLAIKTKNRAVSVPVWGLVFLIGVSRLYLGVHFASDIVIGWLLGITLLALFIRWEKEVQYWFTAQSFSRQITLSILFSFVLLSLMVLPVLIEPTWKISTAWIINASKVIPAEDFTPLDISGAFTISGTFLGMTLGFITLRHRFQLFDTAGALKTRVFRYLVGIIGVIIIWYGLGQVLPRTNDFPGFALRFLRYTLVGFWVAYLAPILFFRIGLLNKKISSL